MFLPIVDERRPRDEEHADVARKGFLHGPVDHRRPSEDVVVGGAHPMARIILACLTVDHVFVDVDLPPSL